MFLPVIQTAVLVLALIATHPASADFEAGQLAWDAGKVDKALTQWRDAANAGDRRAMLALGRLYQQGLGVVQDYVEAHKWFNLAASRGVAEALEARDMLEMVKMTPAQVAKAQDLAASWQPRGFPSDDLPDSGTPKTGELPPVATSTADAGSLPQQAIHEAEALLETLGYRSGPSDGIWNQSTKVAYQAFLRDAGLPQAETLTPQALRAMRMLAERQGIDTGASVRTEQASAPSEATELQPTPVSLDALHRAVQAGDIEEMKSALAAGVDVNQRDDQGWTALMHAANKGYPQLAGLLLEARAHPDIQAPDGATALFIAAVHGQAQVVALLIDAGASISIQGPQDKTAMDVARIRGDSDVMKELGAAEARQYANKMVSISGGRFRMGNQSRDDGFDSEKPVRRVKIPAFRLGKYEVTVGQFRGFVEAAGYRTDAERNAGESTGCRLYTGNGWEWKPGSSWQDPGFSVGDEHPVVCVSWNDAMAFSKWLAQETGESYRLPSEAEWEYAVRAGSSTRFSWGDDIGSNRANCDNDECGDGYEYTAPVGSFPANAWGLHDMHGNVHEWVQDCWNDSYDGAPTDGSAWESEDCSQRVIRSGSWGSSHAVLRAAIRGGSSRYGGGNLVGFRLAQDE